MASKLHSLGHDPIRLNTDEIPGSTAFNLSLNGEGWTGGISIGSDQQSFLGFEDVRSVLVRRPGFYNPGADMEHDEQAFVTAELDHAIGGLWASLPCRWVSHPTAIRAASWKIEQLGRAKNMGFEAPRTLVSTDPERVKQFYEQCSGKIIYKCISGPGAIMGAAGAMGVRPPDLQLPTVMITEDQLEHVESVSQAPCLFQEYIEKDVELRVTVIGDEVFTAAIHSQEHPKTKVDFRHFDVDIPYRKAKLPDGIERLCVEFVQSYDLLFGAIDLILTPDGRYIFIENNPVGQFMFVEHLVPELRMCDALASLLIRGSGA
nr:hypothetical protein [Nocardiopsis gilva]